MKTMEMIEAIKARHNVASDYAAARLLGVSPQQVSMYRSGSRHLGDETALVVADLLDLPADYVLTCVQAERTKDEGLRTVWLKAAAKLKKGAKTSAKASMLIGATALLMGQPDRALAAQKGAPDVTVCILC